LFSEQKSTFQDAVALCRSYGGDLASFDSMDAHDAVFEYLLANSTVNQAWLGGMFTEDANHSLIWIDMSPVIDWGFPFAMGQPDNNNDREFCLMLQLRDTAENPVGAWYDERCSRFRGPICKREIVTITTTTTTTTVTTTTTQLSGWVPYNGRRYLFVANKTTWEEADQYCTSIGA
jgi:hypothetical protein